MTRGTNKIEKQVGMRKKQSPINEIKEGKIQKRAKGYHEFQGYKNYTFNIGILDICALKCS